MEVKTDKTIQMIVYFGRKELEFPHIIMHGSQIKIESEFKLLEIIFNNQLTWDGNVDYIAKKPQQDYIF